MLIGGFAAVLVILYAVVVSIYSSGGTLDGTGAASANADIVLELSVGAVDPGNNSAQLQVRTVSVRSPLVDADGRLTRTVRLDVWSSDGADEVILPAGTLASRSEVTVGVAGNPAGFPFDRYTSSAWLTAAQVLGDDPLSRTQLAPISLGLTFGSGVPDWDATAEVTTTTEGWLVTEWVFERAFSTKFFAVLTVVMALLLALFLFIAGVSVLSGRQRVDSSLVAWGAALVFALLALRFYVPGDPPIGSGVDLYAYMWVMFIAFVGASMLTVAWLRLRSESSASY